MSKCRFVHPTGTVDPCISEGVRTKLTSDMYKLQIYETNNNSHIKLIVSSNVNTKHVYNNDIC